MNPDILGEVKDGTEPEPHVGAAEQFRILVGIFGEVDLVAVLVVYLDGVVLHIRVAKECFDRRQDGACTFRV